MDDDGSQPAIRDEAHGVAGSARRPATAGDDGPSGPRVVGIYMIGVLPRQLQQSLAFYRALGVELAQDGERLHFATRSPGSVVFFVNATGFVRAVDAPRVALEFRLGEPAAVEEAYALALDAGGQPYREPERAPFGDYLAMVLDPDGNVVALSAPGDAEAGPSLP